MWAKIKHQTIKDNALLAKSVAKDELYNKFLYDTYIVKQANNNNLVVEAFLENPFMILSSWESGAVMPIQLTMTLRECSKNNWFMWID